VARATDGQKSLAAQGGSGSELAPTDGDGKSRRPEHRETARVSEAPALLARSSFEEPMETTARPTLADRLYAAFDAIRGKDQPEPAKPPLEKVATIPVAAPQPSPAMSPQALLAGNLDAAQGLRAVSKGDNVPVTSEGAQFPRQATPRPTLAEQLAADS